jgi:hypothetical protein
MGTVFEATDVAFHEVLYAIPTQSGLPGNPSSPCRLAKEAVVVHEETEEISHAKLSKRKSRA